MSPRNLGHILDALIAAFDENADYKDPWQVVMFCGLKTAAQATVAARYKTVPNNTGIRGLENALKDASKPKV